MAVKGTGKGKTRGLGCSGKDGDDGEYLGTKQGKGRGEGKAWVLGTKGDDSGICGRDKGKKGGGI